MAAAHQIDVPPRSYTVVDDVTTRFDVLFSGAIRDALTHRPVLDADVTTSVRGLLTKVVDGGLFCIAGEQNRVFPQLAAHDYSVPLAVRAPRYVPQTRTETVHAGATLPLVLAPFDLRRPPVRVQGRVVESETDRSRVPAATVRVVDDPAIAAPPRHVAALRIPLTFDHAATTPVHVRTLQAAGPGRQLGAAAARGATSVILDAGPLPAAGEILALGPLEQNELVAVAGPGTAPHEVHLRTPLSWGFAKDTHVGRLTLGAVTATRALHDDAAAGDGLVYLDAVTTGVVELADADPAHVEYRSIGAVADPDGFYALDGIRDVEQIFLEARDPALAAPHAPVAVVVDYDAPVNVANLRAS